MYGYNEYIPLNVNEILKRVSEEEIFGIAIQEDIVLDKGAKYLAPYRTDEIPECYFEKHNGVLRFVDFANGTGSPSLNCFQFIQKLHNVDFKKALEVINESLSLGLGDNLGKAKKISYEHNHVEEKNVKKVFKERVITILPRQYNYKDKQFWSKYEISSENLIEDNVIAVELYKSISKTGQHFSVRPTDICYAYTEFESGKSKIYRPYASKDAKWFTNCNQNNIGSVSHLPDRGKTLIISKSYKDSRVIRNQDIPSIWFQNEGQIPSRSVIKPILDRFESVVVWFDNDNTGITNSRVVVSYLNEVSGRDIARSIMLPPRLLPLGIKDPSDCIAIDGKGSLLKFLKNKKLL